MATILFVAYVRFGLDEASLLDYDPFLFKTIVMSAVYITTFYLFDLYSPNLYRPGLAMMVKLESAVIVSTVVLFSIYFLTPSVKTWRGILLATTLVLPFIVLIFRFISARWLRFELQKEKVLILGSGGLAKKFGQTIYNNPNCGLHLAGFIDDDPAKLGVSIVNPGVVGGYGDILRLVKSEEVRRIIVALPDRRAKLPMSALLDCKLMGVVVEEGETFNEKLEGKIPLEQLKPSWMVFSDGFKSLRSRKIVKRVLDLVLSAVILIPSLPMLLITPIIIKLESRGPVIFKQTRVGENGKEFEIYKFRSMRADAEAKSGPVWAGKNDDRTTLVGKLIRKTRIDELPQLFNVLKGDMSFVGPRPERPFFVNELKKTIPYYEVRNVVKPGITGWTQVKYPYGATVEDAKEKLQYDIYYIKNMSPVLD
ncbi:MAG: TIGR03013 family PEP-CTERM/XrtA system glycosyltransferase, partial [Candidatus Heimdallarchaeota archaeon]|nr:TIGR03013 family PEP-CTERM/XrtA system glycosyltransferase [Candidatus Heimdallarchaeota archaeon]